MVFREVEIGPGNSRRIEPKGDKVVHLESVTERMFRKWGNKGSGKWKESREASQQRHVEEAGQVFSRPERDSAFPDGSGGPSPRV